MIEAGTVLQQRYRIDKQIGQGGMGAVYVATDERFGSTVAIKETLCMDDNFRKAIEREARLLNSLKHSALPKVSDHFIENEVQFLVMEYIPGEDLGFMLERDLQPFDVDLVLNWADQLLDALDFLHNQFVPVVHRDIKPQNLKLAQRGQIILLDFGLAKGNPTDASHQTAAKSIFGYSRSYASLEQIQGTGTDPRSDLYSLSATLYHLLTASPPEDALTRAMSVLGQNADPLRPANSIRPEIPRGVAGVLQKGLDLNAAGRPSTASEMRQMFRESEYYGYLAETATFATTHAESPILAEETKLMPEETRAGETRQTDIKTEVLPGYVSEVTSVSSARTGEPTRSSPAHLTAVAAPKRRGLGLAAGALIVLLVGCAVAGGIYMFNPSIFGATRVADKSVVPVASDVNAAPAANNGTAETGSGSGQEPANASTHSGETTGKTVETAKGAKPPATEKSKQPAAGDDEKSADVGEPDQDDVTITERGKNGKVTTTHVRPAPIPSYMQGLPNGQFPYDRLTPEQRRKLQRVMRNNPGMRPMPANRP